MTKKVKAAIIIIFLILSGVKGYTQVKECGTVATPEYIENYKKLLQSKSGTFTSLECISRTLSVAVHIIPDSANSYIPDAMTIAACVAKLPPAFSPICLDFQVCSIDTVHSDFYLDDFLDKFLLVENIALHYNKAHTINVYFIADLPIMDVGGFATLPSTPTTEGFICVRYSAMTASTIVHEAGHYFGLLHTFETGDELADESNCTTAGDLICDTNADPDSTGDFVDSNCRYFGTFVDANGDYYFPPISNIMSYYGYCRCEFSHLQYAAMAVVYHYFYQNQLW